MSTWPRIKRLKNRLPCDTLPQLVDKICLVRRFSIPTQPVLLGILLDLVCHNTRTNTKYGSRS